MTLTTTQTNHDPSKFLLGSQYFIYFGVMGVFLPYFNLYCYNLGFNGFQIGTMSALRTFTTVMFPVLWGVVADKFHIRKPVYILCNFVSTAVWALYLFTENFYLMSAVTIVYGIFYAPIIAFLEAFTMDLLGSEKKGYGNIRAWGSVSFILVVLVLGKVIDIFPIKIILGLILAGSIIQALISIKIPVKVKFRDHEKKGKLSDISNFKTMIFLFCAFLMLLSHGTYYGFFSIHLEQAGFGRTFIGFSWALASIAEISVMLKSRTLFKHLSYNKVLLISFFIAAVRWLMLYFSASPYVILASQVLHAFTYGAFHMASILYMDKLTPEGSKTLGQGVNNAVTYGFGIGVGFVLNGYYFETLNTILFLVSSGIALTGGLLLLGAMKSNR